MDLILNILLFFHVTNIIVLSVFHIKKSSHSKDVYLISAQVLSIIVAFWIKDGLISNLSSIASLLFVISTLYSFYITSEVKCICQKYVSTTIYVLGLLFIMASISKHLNIQFFSIIILLYTIILIIWNTFVIKEFNISYFLIIMFNIIVLFYLYSFVNIISNPSKYNQLYYIHYIFCTLNTLIGIFSAASTGRISSIIDFKKLYGIDILKIEKNIKKFFKFKR